MLLYFTYECRYVDMLLCVIDMDNENLRRISCGLNAMLSANIGPEVFITIRRTTTNLLEDIFIIDSELLNSKHLIVYSGSKAEGLRFKSSDEDWMCIYRDIRVIPSDSYTALYESNTTLLLMENETTKPGFTLLRLVSEYAKPEVTRSIENILNGHYLSCKCWREFHTKKSEFTHGPCASGTIGPHEYDIAYCLRCDIWPANAQDCIRRLHQSAWPSHGTVLNIINDGVLFVPIGAKQSIFENIEWRMSFSLAEKKLIHAMNHTQFLCYGLLKILLKEAIDVNPDVKGLLCSYFLKTALFWEITTTSNQWNPSTLLFRFWNCFCQLLQWVGCSYCPNFFIPQNNMFAGKIEGTNRDKLLQHLRILHYEGYSCLLRCHSFADDFAYYIIPRYAETFEVKTDKISIADEIINESNSGSHLFGIKSILMYLFAFPTTSHQIFLLKTWLQWNLTKFSISGTSFYSFEAACNKSHYNNLTKRINTVRRSQTDSVSHLLYQAMLCYNNGRYTHTLRLVQQSKEKISYPHSFYRHVPDKNDRRSIYCNDRSKRKRYTEAGLDQLPIETVLSRNYLDYIDIKNNYIPEFHLETHNLDIKLFLIPPLVYAFFLQYLCQRKLGHLREADNTLYELSLLVQHDDGHHIGLYCREISWHIVGICQQMSSENRAACRSFMTAQKHMGKVYFKVAASIRLGTMLLKYFNNF